MAVLVMAFFFGSSLFAQEYKAAVGGRLSYGGLLNYRHQLKQDLYGEGIFSIRWGGVAFTALLEQDFDLNLGPNFSTYAGGGIHLGLHGRNNVINPAEGTNESIQINLGIDLVGGIEYRFDGLPLAASIDYIPSFQFVGERWLILEGFGLSIRYIMR